jgi:FMN-dependent NADH-azoreductase
MKNVLLITSSPRGEMSHSSRVASELAQQVGGNLTIRELWRNPSEPIGPSFVHAAFTPEADRTAEQRGSLVLADTEIDELLAADVLIIAAGMINFGMPASLKTWIDQIARKGKTFHYTESGPEGLLKGKRAILVLAAGGVYSSGPMAGLNHLEPGLRAVLSFLGIADIETVWIEGIALGDESINQALKQATERTREVAASAR